MVVAHESQSFAKVIDSPLVKNAAIRVLVGPSEGWADHVMRVVELGPEGYSPRHSHPWPHINYIIEGQGLLILDGRELSVRQGFYAYVPSGADHQFRNAGSGQFRFICIVPKEGHQ
jgi:quercetin dioxygenase-like cupin family protein